MRPLDKATSPSRAAFTARQPSATSGSDGADARGTRTMHARGRRGTVQFFLQRVSGGLYVEREEIPRQGLRTQQSMAFADAGGFERWCDDDPVGFECPVLYQQLKRGGDDLWRVDSLP